MKLDHILGVIMALTAIVVLSVYSGKLTKGNKGIGSWGVFGAITGTLVGGSSTIGTAQLAFHYGMSAWWFTLGGGLACLVLALGFIKPLRASHSKTLTGIIRHEYGNKSGMTASFLSSLGNFISIISQLISATAIIAVFWPTLSHTLSLLISASFMTIYIIFGGTKGSAITGLFKMILLYIAVFACGALVLYYTGGISGFSTLVNTAITSEVPIKSMFARGIGTDLGACLSLILGVLTTQAYAQPIFLANSTKAAKTGALISAVITPTIGIGGILVGLYMRATQPDISPKTALTTFIIEKLPPLVSGILLGALFIAVLGTGAGVASGIAACIKNDVLSSVSKNSKLNSPYIEKIAIASILFLATIFSTGTLGDTILSFGFLSLGLRGATVFVPLCCALWLPGKIKNRYVMTALFAGPLTVLVFWLWDVLPFDPLFAGVLCAMLIMAVGLIKPRKKTS